MKRRIKEELFNHDLYINQVKDLLIWHFEDHKESLEHNLGFSVLIDGMYVYCLLLLFYFKNNERRLVIHSNRLAINHTR